MPKLDSRTQLLAQFQRNPPILMMDDHQAVFLPCCLGEVVEHFGIAVQGNRNIA